MYIVFIEQNPSCAVFLSIKVSGAQKAFFL